MFTVMVPNKSHAGRIVDEVVLDVPRDGRNSIRPMLGEAEIGNLRR